ncbi:hypothetical protein HN873_021796, partial [Arachis hypogaea]
MPETRATLRIRISLTMTMYISSSSRGLIKSMPRKNPELRQAYICYISYHLLLDIQTSLSTPVRKPRKLKIY